MPVSIQELNASLEACKAKIASHLIYKSKKEINYWDGFYYRNFFDAIDYIRIASNFYDLTTPFQNLINLLTPTSSSDEVLQILVCFAENLSQITIEGVDYKVELEGDGSYNYPINEDYAAQAKMNVACQILRPVLANSLDISRYLAECLHAIPESRLRSATFSDTKIKGSPYQFFVNLHNIKVFNDAAIHTESIAQEIIEIYVADADTSIQANDRINTPHAVNIASTEQAQERTALFSTMHAPRRFLDKVNPFFSGYGKNSTEASQNRCNIS